MGKKSKKAKNIIKQQISATELRARIPLFIAWIAVPVWIYIVFKNYFSKYAFAPLRTLEIVFSTSAFPDTNWGLIFKTQGGHLINILFILAFWVSVFGWGSLLLKKDEYNSENNLFRIALGSAVTSFFVFIIGNAGLLYAFPVILFLIAGFILGFNKALECVKKISLKSSYTASSFGSVMQ